MKTKAQIEELAKFLAKEFYNDSYPKIANFDGIESASLQNAIIHVVVKTYEKAQTDLLESASEGFEEWYVETWGISPDEIQIEGLADLKKRIWQASRLGMEKEKEGLKYELDFLSNVAKSNMELIHKNEKLQNEIKQLKEDLEWVILQLSVHMKVLKIDNSELTGSLIRISNRHGLYRDISIKENCSESSMSKRLKEDKCNDCHLYGGYHHQDCKYNPF